jgi:hypothetical protein
MRRGEGDINESSAWRSSSRAWLCGALLLLLLQSYYPESSTGLGRQASRQRAGRAGLVRIGGNPSHRPGQRHASPGGSPVTRRRRAKDLSASESFAFRSPSAIRVIGLDSAVTAARLARMAGSDTAGPGRAGAAGRPGPPALRSGR